MASHPNPAIDLTDAEKRDLVTLIQNEITWKRQPPQGARAVASQFARTSDNLLFFTRGESHRWTSQFREYSEEYIKSKFTMVDAVGRRYRVGDTGDYSER